MLVLYCPEQSVVISTFSGKNRWTDVNLDGGISQSMKRQLGGCAHANAGEEIL